MTTTEHLARIRAKCVELLEIASKRTPGKWEWKKNRRGYHVLVHVCHGEAYPNGDTVEKQILDDGSAGDEYSPAIDVTGPDARFIASCAGPAEAGWRATIAAIDGLNLIYADTEGCADGSPDASALAKQCNATCGTAYGTLEHILAAWPEELL